MTETTGTTGTTGVPVIPQLFHLVQLWDLRFYYSYPSCPSYTNRSTRARTHARVKQTRKEQLTPMADCGRTHPTTNRNDTPGICHCGQRLWGLASIERGYCEHCEIYHHRRLMKRDDISMTFSWQAVCRDCEEEWLFADYDERDDFIARHRSDFKGHCVLSGVKTTKVPR